MGPVATSARRRRSLENGAMVALVGIAVVGVIGAALTAIYLNRITDSASALRRTESIPDYVGRPLAATTTDGRPAMNVLIAVADGTRLEAVVLANLSADRRNLTLITAPPGLRSDAGSQHTLAGIYAAEPTMSTRAVEGMVGTRVDHFVQVDLDGLASMIDAVGGVRVDGGRLTGAQAVAAVRTASDPSTTAAGILRAVMVGAGSRSGLAALAVPVDLILAASHCTQVDADLTSEVIEETLMDSSVHADEIRLWPLATAVENGSLVPDRQGLAALATALATPNLPSTAEYGADAFLPR